MTREPLITVAGVIALVGAIVSLVVAFGIDLTKDQQAAILGLTTVAAPVLVGLIVRPKVTPVADPRP